MREEELSLSTPSVQLSLTIHHPEEHCRGWIITAHGLFSSKNSEKFIELGNAFGRRGYCVVRFDFRGCGESGGRIEDTTVSGRREDLEAVLSYVIDQRSTHQQGIGMLGSSLGGYLSLLVASGNRAVRAVVAWATPSSIAAIRTAINRNTQGGVKEGFYRDAKHYHASSFVPKVQRLLLIHGNCDDTVPEEHARKLYRLAHQPKELVIIPGADHSISNPRLRKEATDLSLRWFRNQLNA